MLLTHKVKIPIYHQSVLFLIGDAYEVQDYLADINQKDFGFDVNTTDAIAYHFGLNHIIWLSQEVDFPQLVHELGHVTFGLMTDIGLDYRDQEAFCYIQQFILEELKDVFNIKMDPIKQV